jgi:hypothetical protein
MKRRTFTCFINIFKQELILNTKKVLVNSIYFRGIITWIGLCLFAYVNGALRELVFKKVIGIIDPIANQLSCLSGIILWTLFVSIIWSWLNIKSSTMAFFMGMGWLVATVIFETFIIDRNLNWNQIIETYNFASGNFWGLVLIWIAILPLTIYYFCIFRLYLKN